MFQNKNYLPHFVSEDMISLDDLHDMYNLSDDDRAMCILKVISTPLRDGGNQPFYKMLEVMRINGNPDAQQLSEDINAFVKGVSPVVVSDTTKTTTVPATGKY